MVSLPVDRTIDSPEGSLQSELPDKRIESLDGQPIRPTDSPVPLARPQRFLTGDECAIAGRGQSTRSGVRFGMTGSPWGFPTEDPPAGHLFGRDLILLKAER